MSIETAQLGWMAAVLDLQGALLEKRNQSRATPQYVIMVETKMRPVISRLCAMTGQTVEVKQAHPLPEEWMRRGCAEHCPEAHIHQLAGQKPMPLISRWAVTGASAAIVLHSLRPYLTSWDDKGYGDAYQIILKQMTLSGRGSGATRSAIRRLMGLGWPLPDSGWLASLLAPPGSGVPSGDQRQIAVMSGVTLKAGPR